MNKIIKTFIVLLFLQSSVSNAWTLFGPKNFDECILKSNKGVTSDIAARNIAWSCRNKFPIQEKECISEELTNSQRELVTRKPKIRGSGGTYTFELDLYNGNKDKALSEILVELNADSVSSPQRYKMHIRGSPPYMIDPYATGRASVFTQKLEGNMTYKIISLKGCKQ